MIGKRVRWKHKKPDGTPIVPHSGTIVAFEMSTSTSWAVLVQEDSGGFFTCNPIDLEVVNIFDAIAQAKSVEDVPHEPDCEVSLEKTIRDLGLWEPNGTCAGMQASVLLNDFMSELRAKDEALKAAEAELEKLKKKKPKTEKKEETP